MKNAAHKNIRTHCDRFVRLVRAHHTVNQCYSIQQHMYSISRNEKEFRKNPWEYVQKKLQPVKDSAEPSFNVSTAVSHFTQTYSRKQPRFLEGHWKLLGNYYVLQIPSKITF